MVTLNTGQLFADRYRIERPLATGGMGAVYVATHLATEAEVALKVMLPNRLNSELARERFQQEARVAARVRCEHIVQVLDAGLDEATDMPFFAMELLEGCSLAEHVEARGCCTRAETTRYLHQVARGLSRAHGYRDPQGAARPIVHRDLKPENLFLTHRDDGSPLVKILDFGIAKLMSESMEFSRDIKGTPEYMALEQIRGEQACVQTDIWPLGLIAFYLLTGKCYWLAANDSEWDVQRLFQELLSQERPPPSERARRLGVEPSWAAAFDRWFARCLEAEPHQRFPTAQQAADALEQALDHAPDEVTGALAAEEDPTQRSHVRPTATDRPRARASAPTEPLEEAKPTRRRD